MKQQCLSIDQRIYSNCMIYCKKFDNLAIQHAQVYYLLDYLEDVTMLGCILKADSSFNAPLSCEWTKRSVLHTNRSAVLCCLSIMATEDDIDLDDLLNGISTRDIQPQR